MEKTNIQFIIINHDPETFALTDISQDKDEQYPVLGKVERQKDGSWNSSLDVDAVNHYLNLHENRDNSFKNNEPNKEHAMEHLHESLINIINKPQPY